MYSSCCIFYQTSSCSPYIDSANQLHFRNERTGPIAGYVSDTHRSSRRKMFDRIYFRFERPQFGEELSKEHTLGYS